MLLRSKYPSLLFCNITFWVGPGSGGTSVAAGTTIFVSNLAWSLDEKHISAIAIPYGRVLSIDIARHLDTNKPKGWGLIVFAEQAGAEAAIKALNGFEVCDRRLTVRMDRMQMPDKGSDCHVYVGNLSFDIDTAMLFEYFVSFSPVSADVARTSFGNDRGFGIVRFANSAAAMLAINAMHHTYLCGRKIEVSHFCFVNACLPAFSLLGSLLIPSYSTVIPIIIFLLLLLLLYSTVRCTVSLGPRCDGAEEGLVVCGQPELQEDRQRAERHVFPYRPC
jgi:hypothetical protein